MELRPKSRENLEESQKVKLKACIDVSIKTAQNSQRLGKRIDIVDLAYYINMRENEKIDYEIVRDMCEEYVSENKIDVIL